MHGYFLFELDALYTFKEDVPNKEDFGNGQDSDVETGAGDPCTGQLWGP